MFRSTEHHDDCREAETDDLLLSSLHVREDVRDSRCFIHSLIPVSSTLSSLPPPAEPFHMRGLPAPPSAGRYIHHHLPLTHDSRLISPSLVVLCLRCI